MITGSRVQSGLSRLAGEKSDRMILEGSHRSWHFSMVERKHYSLPNSGPRFTQAEPGPQCSLSQACPGHS